MLLSCASLLLALQAAHVTGYTDVRYTPCMNTFLTQKIPMNRSQWSGVIEMVMKCDAGYDFPLNAPDNGVFHCKPDLKSWTPSFIPDCNKKMLPKKLNLVLGFRIAKADCDRLGTDVGDGKTIRVGGKTAALDSICGDKLKDCTLTKVVKVCEGTLSEPDTDQDFWIKEFEKSGKPFVAMIVSVTKPTANGMEILQHVNSEVRANLMTSLGLDTEVKLKAVCETGSLGIIDSQDNFLCRGCSLGHYLDRQQKRCVPCPAGKYQDEPLALQCKVCPSLFGLQDKTIQDKIKQKYDAGSFSLIFCPSLTKDNKLRDPFATLGKPQVSSRDIKMPGNINPAAGCSQHHASLLLPLACAAVVLAYRG